MLYEVITRRMFGVLNKGGAESLPLSRFHFGGLGTKMMQKVMKQNRMPGVPELMETALDLGVRFIACTTTMGLMGITKDTLIEGIDQFAGVTTYLAEANRITSYNVCYTKLLRGILSSDGTIDRGLSVISVQPARSLFV